MLIEQKNKTPKLARASGVSYEVLSEVELLQEAGRVPQKRPRNHFCACETEKQEERTKNVRWPCL